MLCLLSTRAVKVDLAGAWRERHRVVEMISFDFRLLIGTKINSYQRAEKGTASHSHQMVSIRRHEQRRVIPFYDQFRFLAGRAQPKSLLIFPFAIADNIASRPHLPNTVFKATLAFSHFFRHIILSVDNGAGVRLIRDLAEFVGAD